MINESPDTNSQEEKVGLFMPFFCERPNREKLWFFSVIMNIIIS